MKKIYWNEYLINVVFEGFDRKDKIDLKDKELFEKSVVNYLNLFNQLPLIGQHISNGNCDAGEVKQINFGGNDKKITLFLDF